VNSSLVTGDQKECSAIARAVSSHLHNINQRLVSTLIRKPTPMLLDDATATLDNEFERLAIEVIERLLSSSGSRTTHYNCSSTEFDQSLRQNYSSRKRQSDRSRLLRTVSMRQGSEALLL
jgi:hypothetical protein